MITLLRRATVTIAVPVALCACGGEAEPDAYGTFEATEVVVSAETAGRVEQLLAAEGIPLAAGALAVVVDTTQLALERRQVAAQREAAGSRGRQIDEELRVLQAQREIAQRGYERVRRLYEQRAATAQELDQAERELRTLVARIEAARAQRAGAGSETEASVAREAQLGERIDRSRVRNPTGGTVLELYVRTGEVVQPGQPLYRIADLDTLELRAYVAGDQLSRVRLGQPAQVRIDGAPGELERLTGRVAWIAAEAEFTPTPIQTREERTDLVYAVKIRVPNTGGRLRIGMPGDVSFTAAAAGGRGSGGEER